MTNAALRGKPDAGNPHVRFDEGEVAPAATPRRGSLLYKKYVCKVCGYVYDPENNNGVAFEDLPEDWTCPMCGVGKDQFEEM